MARKVRKTKAVKTRRRAAPQSPVAPAACYVVPADFGWKSGYIALDNDGGADTPPDRFVFSPIVAWKIITDAQGTRVVPVALSGREPCAVIMAPDGSVAIDVAGAEFWFADQTTALGWYRKMADTKKVPVAAPTAKSAEEVQS
jgi:hypothetical protein